MEPKRHAVLSSQRMIGHEGIKLAIVLVGQILHSLQLYVHLEILHALSKPLGTLKMTTFPQEAVHFILVNGLLEPETRKEGTNFAFAPILLFKILLMSIVFSIDSLMFAVKTSKVRAKITQLFKYVPFLMKK